MRYVQLQREGGEVVRDLELDPAAPLPGVILAGDQHFTHATSYDVGGVRRFVYRRVELLAV